MCKENIASLRDGKLDNLKALAIWMVIWGHILAMCMPDGRNTHLCMSLYLVHIPLFLVISGYLCKDKQLDSNLGKSILSRFLVPYAIWTLALTLFYAGFTYLLHNGLWGNVQSYLISLRDGMWFIRVFVITYLLWQVLQFLKPLCRLLTGTVLLVALNTCFFSVNYMSELFSLSLYTYTIYATAAYLKEKVRNVSFAGVTLLALLFFLCLYNYEPEYDYFRSSFSVLWNSGEWHIFFLRFFAGIAFSIIVLSLISHNIVRWGGYLSAFTQQIGRNTLQIYMIQSMLVEGILPRIIHLDRNIMGYTISLVLSLFMTLLCHFIIQQSSHWKICRILLWGTK